MVITQPLPCSSTATMLVVSARLLGARRASISAAASVRQSSDPHLHRRNPRHGAEQIIKIITAGVNGEILHPNRSRGRLDHVVGVQVFLAQSPAVGDGDDQCIGVRAVIERARISQHELVRSVMIRMAQRVAGLQVGAVKTLEDLNTLPDAHRRCNPR